MLAIGSSQYTIVIFVKRVSSLLQFLQEELGLKNEEDAAQLMLRAECALQAMGGGCHPLTSFSLPEVLDSFVTPTEADSSSLTFHQNLEPVNITSLGKLSGKKIPCMQRSQLKTIFFFPISLSLICEVIILVRGMNVGPVMARVSLYSHWIAVVKS